MAADGGDQGFTPTDKQVEFRDFAAECVANAQHNAKLPWMQLGLKPLLDAIGDEEDRRKVEEELGEKLLAQEPAGLYSGEWLTIAKDYLDDPPTRREWVAWDRDHSFREWFLDAIPIYQPPTETDIRALVGLYHQAMAHALARGDKHAMQHFGNRLAKQEEHEAGEGDIVVHIRAARSRTSEIGGWRAPTATEIEQGRDVEED